MGIGRYLGAIQRSKQLNYFAWFRVSKEFFFGKDQFAVRLHLKHALASYDKNKPIQDLLPRISHFS